MNGVHEPVDDPVEADTIDGSFVPRSRDDMASLEIDGEMVLVEGTDLRVVHLDSIGTIVWRCFDGSATVDELADDLSDAFGADRETVGHDVVELARELGRAGLLVGVASRQPSREVDRGQPEGLPLGTEVDWTGLVDLRGRPVEPDRWRDNQVLVVNWNPECGYCERIAPALAEVEPALARRGVELVLLAIGTPESNRALVDATGLGGTVLLRGDTDRADPFTGIGTPAAYLLDAAGRIATPLTIGADQVPELARAAAQLDPGGQP